MSAKKRMVIAVLCLAGCLPDSPPYPTGKSY